MARSAAFFLAIFALSVSAAIVEPPGLAPSLRVSPGEEAALLLTGNGANLHQCRPRATDSSAYAWFFVTPEATLYDGGRPVATHTAAYRWDSTSDRSSVTGVIVATQDGARTTFCGHCSAPFPPPRLECSRRSPASSV
jgi:hypothetical protein